MLNSTVFVVDDNTAVRDALLTLLDTVGIRAVGFETGESFLAQLDASHCGCILLDVRMPGIGGLAIARHVRERGFTLPIVFISAHGDVRLAVEAMRLGAQDFIEKPFRDQDVIDRVQYCFELDRNRRTQSHKLLAVRRRMRELTEREHIVLERVVRGEPNKQIAASLHLSQRTIEVHRAHLMEKMQVSSLAELVSTVTWAGAVELPE